MPVLLLLLGCTSRAPDAVLAYVRGADGYTIAPRPLPALVDPGTMSGTLGDVRHGVRLVGSDGEDIAWNPAVSPLLEVSPADNAAYAIGANLFLLLDDPRFLDASVTMPARGLDGTAILTEALLPNPDTLADSLLPICDPYALGAVFVSLLWDIRVATDDPEGTLAPPPAAAELAVGEALVRQSSGRHRAQLALGLTVAVPVRGRWGVVFETVGTAAGERSAELTLEQYHLRPAAMATLTFAHWGAADIGDVWIVEPGVRARAALSLELGGPVSNLQYAWLALTFPVHAERPLGKGWSVAGGPALVSRQTFLNLVAAPLSVSTATFELYAGGGLRMQHTGKRLKLEVSADVYLDTTRATGLYGGVGFDLGTVARPRAGSASDEIETAAQAETE